MTTEGMMRIGSLAIGNLSDWDCRMIISNMTGYMVFASDPERMKEHFFSLVRDAAEETVIKRQREKQSLQQESA